MKGVATPERARVSSVATTVFDGVVHRGISGLRPLWWSANIGIGRWHGPGQSRPVQYLSLHPMGPLAEHARHTGAATASDLRELRRNVFALRVHLDNVLHLDFDTARGLGLDPHLLVGPPSSYPACAAWLGALLDGEPHIDGVRTPNAALPGTETLVVVGRRHPLPYLEVPRRPVDIPCAMAAAEAHAPASLAGHVVPLGSTAHPALAAWRRGRADAFTQPRASV